MIASGAVSIIPGILHTVTINRADAHAGGTVTLYDSIDAGGCDAAHMIANVIVDTAVYVIPTTLVYDCELTHGLYVAFDAGLTTTDITVSYK